MTARRKEKAQLHEDTRVFAVSFYYAELQSSDGESPLPMISFEIVAYAFTLLWDNLCRSSFKKAKKISCKGRSPRYKSKASVLLDMWAAVFPVSSRKS